MFTLDTQKKDFKNMLKNEITKWLKENQRYFNRQDIDIFKSKSPALNRYLTELNKEGIFYSAGRGWYSFIKESFELEQQTIKQIVTTIEKKYPLLSFSVWSTEQLKSFVHHMFARFIIFIYVNRDDMSGIYDFLRDSGYDVWLNPRKNDIQKFSTGEKTVIIRPAISREKSKGHFANTEKIFIDLFVESSKLSILDKDEYYKILGNVLISGRFNIGSMLNYAKRRKLKIEKFIRIIKST